MKNLLFSLLFILAGNMAAGQSWYNLRNGADGLNALGVIFTTCTDDTGNVYAAGNFPENPDSANSKICVARWSAIRLRWERLGEGAAGINVERTIETMCVDKAGNVYAAGGFRDGPFSFSGYFYVARWDGHSWAKLGTGDSALKANRHISSLATDDSGNIYAAGYFLNIYGFCYVAKWSVVTLTWSELGHLSANEIIQSIVVDDSFNVYATGTFTDWQHHPYVAKYSPVTDTWISLGSGFAVPHKFIYKTLLALDTFNHLYVAIDGTDSASFDDSSWIYKWVGTNMVSLGGHAGFKGNTFSVKNDD
ncbi:MAG: hypothetical protein H7257_00060, partial [Taibaiella sp.]|nr:hypothetical protein [Taibaiella sp.]